MEKSTLLKNASVVSFLTFVSRVTGMLRDMAIAHVFGAGALTDMFFVAFRLPNLFRRLFAEGALTGAFVPVFVEIKETQQARIILNKVFTAITTLLSILLLVMIVAAPWLVYGLAPGLVHSSNYDQTVTLVRYLLPYLLLIVWTALGMGVAHSLGFFYPSAAAPVLLNLGMIGGALGLSKFFAQPIYGLVVGVLVGGILQVLIHVPLLKKHHLIPQFDFQLKHPLLEKMTRLFWPSCYGAAIYQFHVLLITALATFLPEGSVSWLWYADRLFQFPLGLVAIAMATVLLPTLSIQAQSVSTPEGRQKLKETLSFSMKITLVLIIPATLGLMLLAKPIVKLLFEHGQFGPDDVLGTQKVLIMTAIGLPFVSISKLLSQVFLSLQQPQILLKASNLSVALHIFFSVLLLKTLASEGLALALSLSAIGHAGYLGYRLHSYFRNNHFHSGTK